MSPKDEFGLKAAYGTNQMLNVVVMIALYLSDVQSNRIFREVVQLTRKRDTLRGLLKYVS